MSLKKNEMAINKACSVKLDDETVAIVAYIYHSKDKTDPMDKSTYRTEVRVAKVSDLENEIAEMKKPENRTQTWRWPNPTWPAEWYLGYDKSNDQAKGAAWLKSKIRKAMPWEKFEELVKDGIKTLGNGEKKPYSGAKYEHEGFEDSDGQTGLSILEPEVLKAHCGKVLWKVSVMKRDIKSKSKAAAAA